MHWANNGDMNGWIMIFMMVFGLLLFIIFTVLLVVGIVFLIRSFGPTGFNIAPAKKTENALETAKMRYAKGEISKEEFEQIKKDLE